MTHFRDYAAVTAAYWAFTLTDGALRMLVLLHFHRLGYSPIDIAVLFLLYEAMGVVTNFLGGWIGARYGLRITLFSGLAVQIVALLMLSLTDPAWAAALAALHQTAVAPVLGADKTSLTEADWIALNAKFAAYETWLGGKAGSAVEKLGLPRVKEILASPAREVLASLVDKDKELEPEFKAISDVDRLTHYHRDMSTLLNNFVNFSDFYSPDRPAVFQAGTLFLDSRSTEFCIQVAAPQPAGRDEQGLHRLLRLQALRRGDDEDRRLLHAG